MLSVQNMTKCRCCPFEAIRICLSQRLGLPLLDKTIRAPWTDVLQPTPYSQFPHSLSLSLHSTFLCYFRFFLYSAIFKRSLSCPFPLMSRLSGTSFPTSSARANSFFIALPMSNSRTPERVFSVK